MYEYFFLCSLSTHSTAHFHTQQWMKFFFDITPSISSKINVCWLALSVLLHILCIYFDTFFSAFILFPSFSLSFFRTKLLVNNQLSERANERVVVQWASHREINFTWLSSPAQNLLYKKFVNHVVRLSDSVVLDNHSFFAAERREMCHCRELWTPTCVRSELVISLAPSQLSGFDFLIKSTRKKNNDDES